MDGGQQALNHVCRDMAQLMVEAIERGGPFGARYNETAQLFKQIRELADAPNDHATPSRQSCPQCGGVGRGVCCGYSGLINELVRLPHPPDTCKTCRFASLLERIEGFSHLLDMPKHGPWEADYVQPAIPPGRTREGTWDNGVLLWEPGRPGSSYIFHVAAMTGISCLYQYSGIAEQWEPPTMGSSRDLTGWEYVPPQSWPSWMGTSRGQPIALRSMPVAFARGLSRYLVTRP